jgi:two-component system NtrC family response regulator
LLARFRPASERGRESFSSENKDVSARVGEKDSRPLPGGERPSFTPEAIEVLKSHVWPGNVRELANVIERAAILCDELPIAPDHLPLQFHTPARFRSLGPMTLDELELHAIHAALARHDGNKPKAAEELGVSLKTLYNKLNMVDEQRRAA